MTPIARTIAPPSVTTISDERMLTWRNRWRTQAIAKSSIATTIPATTSALLTSAIRNGSEWKIPPIAVDSAGDHAPRESRPAAGLLARVRERLRHAHADAGPERRRDPDEERRVRARRDGRREDRRQRRDGPVDQADQRRLDDLQDEVRLVGSRQPLEQPAEQRARTRRPPWLGARRTARRASMSGVSSRVPIGPSYSIRFQIRCA